MPGFKSKKQNCCNARRTTDTAIFYNRFLKGKLDLNSSPITGDFSVLPNKTVILNTFDLVLSNLLPLRGGMLIHCSGVRWGKHTLLFPAVSTSGKSTIANILDRNRAVRVIDDEANVLWKRAPGRYEIQRYPFRDPVGVAQNEQRFPVSYIFFLCGKGANDIRPLTQKEALRLLLRNTFQVLLNSKGMERMLEVASHVVKDVPCFALSFKKDESIIGFLAGELGLPR